MGEPLTPHGLFLRDGLLALGFDEESANEAINFIEQEAADAARAAAPSVEPGVTHGRHCPCSACRRQDWTETGLAHCGMHGPLLVAVARCTRCGWTSRRMDG